MDGDGGDDGDDGIKRQKLSMLGRLKKRREVVMPNILKILLEIVFCAVIADDMP